MTPIDYIRIPLDILQRPDLCDKQKMLLGLIISFGVTGLRMSNGKIAELLILNSDYVSRIISDLEAKKYVNITGAQSKYRRIYFEKNLKVETPVLLEKHQSETVLLCGFTPPTLTKTSNRIELTKEEEENQNSSKSAVGEKQLSPPPKIPWKNPIPQGPITPERIHAVYEMLEIPIRRAN